MVDNMTRTSNNQHSPYMPRESKGKNAGHNNSRKIERPESYHEKKKRQFRKWCLRHNIKP